MAEDFIERLCASRSDVRLRLRNYVVEPARLYVSFDLPVPRIVEIYFGQPLKKLALLFFRDPLSPIRCALQLGEALRRRPYLRLRMGIHTGSVTLAQDAAGQPAASGEAPPKSICTSVLWIISVPVIPSPS